MSTVIGGSTWDGFRRGDSGTYPFVLSLSKDVRQAMRS